MDHFLFSVDNGNVTIIGNTQEDLNEHYYDERVEWYGGSGWDLPINDRWGEDDLLVDIMCEEPGYRCGGLYYSHEEKDEYESAYDCMLGEMGLTQNDIAGTYQDYITFGFAKALPNGYYVLTATY